MVVLNKTLTLLSVTEAHGHSGSSEISAKAVKASVNQPGVSLAMKAEYAGYRVDLVAVIRRSDYQSGINYAEYKGIRYRIESVNATDKDLFVRLLLQRG